MVVLETANRVSKSRAIFFSCMRHGWLRRAAPKIINASSPGTLSSMTELLLMLAAKERRAQRSINACYKMCPIIFMHNFCKCRCVNLQTYEQNCIARKWYFVFVETMYKRVVWEHFWKKGIRHYKVVK